MHDLTDADLSAIAREAKTFTDNLPPVGTDRTFPPHPTALVSFLPGIVDELLQLRAHAAKSGVAGHGRSRVIADLRIANRQLERQIDEQAPQTTTIYLVLMECHSVYCERQHPVGAATTLEAADSLLTDALQVRIPAPGAPIDATESFAYFSGFVVPLVLNRGVLILEDLPDGRIRT